MRLISIRLLNKYLQYVQVIDYQFVNHVGMDVRDAL